MRLGVLGTGMVGQTIGSRLIELGHQVKMGSREAGSEKATGWVEEAGEGATEGTFTDAAAFGEVLFNCTLGIASVDVLRAAGAENLERKLLIDVSNPLDFSDGFPPTLAICNDDSLGEQIQAAFPEARVVKALNTMNCEVMVEPSRVAGSHNVFVCGNDDGAKAEMAMILGEFGWPADSIMDLGDITAARGVEMYLPLWLRLYGAVGSGDFNIAVVR